MRGRDGSLMRPLANSDKNSLDSAIPPIGLVGHRQLVLRLRIPAAHPSASLTEVSWLLRDITGRSNAVARGEFKVDLAQ